MNRVSRFRFCIVLALYVLLLQACNTINRHTQSPAYFQKIFDSLATTDVFSTRNHQFLDSLFTANPGADAVSKYNYYSANCGYYHTNTGARNDKMVLLYADSMLWVIHNNSGVKNYDKMDALANISKGDALYDLKEYNQAYQFYYLGKVAAEKSFDACTYSEFSYRLGMAMYKQANFTDAAVHFKKGFEEAGACPELFSVFYRRQELLNNTALSYKKSSSNDSALAYYNKALEFIDSRQSKYPDSKLKFDVARGVVYGNMGQLYALTNHNKAKELYKKSIEINARPGHEVNDALLTQLHLAGLYRDETDYDSMHILLQDISKGLDTVKNRQVSVGWNQLMWKYADSKKDITAAYDYLQEYNRLKEADDADNKKLTESNVTGQMQNLEAAYQVDLLKKDNKIKQMSFIVVAALFVMVGIIMLQLLHNWRKSKQNVQMLTDLNDRINRQKEQLEETLSELEERNKEKDRILGIVAHDLRNPISAISSLIGMLEDGYKYTDDQSQLLKLMQNACTNSIELINEILEFAIKDGGPEDVSTSLVDINQVAKNCVRLLSFKAAEKKQRLQLNVSDTPEIVKANPAKMWRVISNLVTNAVKFSPSGAVIQIKTKHTEQEVLLSVQDRGIGIPDSLKSKIFDTHTEAKRPGTQGEKPFGLGLSICKQIVESYQGKIWFETTVGQGTVFYVSLPKEYDMVVADK